MIGSRCVSPCSGCCCSLLRAVLRLPCGGSRSDVTAYGVAYLFVHDVYIHQRLGRGLRRLRYLEWLRRSHARHHRIGGEPFGMLVPVGGTRRERRRCRRPCARSRRDAAGTGAVVALHQDEWRIDDKAVGRHQRHPHRGVPECRRRTSERREPVGAPGSTGFDDERSETGATWRWQPSLRRAARVKRGPRAACPSSAERGPSRTRGRAVPTRAKVQHRAVSLELRGPHPVREITRAGVHGGPPQHVGCCNRPRS